jgi:hypothetical protein
MISIALAVFVGAALWTPFANAAAQDQPRLAPSRDVVVVYGLTAAEGSKVEKIQVTYSGEGKKARLDFFNDADQPSIGSTIVDQDADLVIMLLPARRAYFEQAAGPARALAFPLDAQMRFTPGAIASVVGQTCREWEVVGSGTRGSACVTSDGVVLRAVRAEPTVGTIEAQSIVYAPQSPTLFVPPAGYVKLIRVLRDPSAMIPQAPGAR